MLLATASAPAGVGGRYDQYCHQADQIRDGLRGVMVYALDPGAAERLWDVSLELVTAARTR